MARCGHHADPAHKGDSPLCPEVGSAYKGDSPLCTLDVLAERADSMGRDRWRHVSDAAQVVAHYLRCHPAVEAVRYPGLKDDPLFERAARTLVGGFGPLVQYRVTGEWRTLECGEGDPRTIIMELEGVLS